MLNLATVLTYSARENPDKDAIVFGAIHLTYKQMDEISNQVANALRSAGIKRGDKVALCCPNLPYFPMAYYGILKAGATVVPFNVLLKRREIAYHLTDSDSVAFFCFEGSPELPLAREGHAAFSEVDACRNMWVFPAQMGGTSPVEGVETFAEMIADQPTAFDMEQMDTDDTAVILYTSGTTGLPKGAELTHTNMTMNAMVSKPLSDVQPDDVLLVVLPLFHSYGQSVMMNTGFMAGSTLVLLPRFDAGEVLRMFQDEGITLFSGVPTMYWELLNFADADKYDIEKISNNLRLCGCGAAAMPVEVMKEFEEKYGVVILEGYGLSETSPVACFNRLDRERKPGSIGLPVWGVEMRAVDDEMNDVAVGEPGEIIIRGHNVMKGYYRRDEANKEAFRGGWFHSGDVATVDDEGYFYIVDRTKDMIIRGGFNVYPREVEEVLVTHPDVSLVAVIGVPDEEYGEEVKAFVIPKAGKTFAPEDIVAWAKKEMAAYKYPRIVEIVSEFPLGPTGKILKTELRKLNAESVKA